MKNLTRLLMTGAAICMLAAPTAFCGTNTPSSPSVDPLKIGQPSKEFVEKCIADFLEVNKDKAFTSEKDKEGRTHVKNKAGKELALQELLPPPLPSKEAMEKTMAGIQKSIAEFLDKNEGKGFTTEKDKDGRTIVKDKDGKIVPLHLIILLPAQTPPDQKLEKAIADYLEKNKDKGYVSEKTPDGRIMVKDKSGKYVTLEIMAAISKSEK